MFTLVEGNASYKRYSKSDRDNRKRDRERGDREPKIKLEKCFAKKLGQMRQKDVPFNIFFLRSFSLANLSNTLSFFLSFSFSHILLHSNSLFHLYLQLDRHTHTSLLGPTHCDQIWWRNFATLAKCLKHLAILWGIIQYLAKCWTTYFCKFLCFWSIFHYCT